MPLPWDKKALEQGRVPPTTWLVLMTFVLIVVSIVFAATRRPHEVLVGSVIVFTDQAIASESPDDCLAYAGRQIKVSSSDGEVLWTGQTEYEFGDIRNPDLGCEIMFFTGPIPVIDRIQVSFEGLPTHTFDFQDALNEHYGIISWDAICVHNDDPCPNDRGNYIH